MANLLNIPVYDPSLDRLNMQLQSQAIQQLGQQVRQDIQQIQTNRQLQGFTKGLTELTPQSQDFSKGVIGLMQQYPMAAHSPIGQAAINQLGAEHKLWQQEQLRNVSPYRAVGGGYGVLDQRTGSITATPEGVLPSKPLQVIRDGYGNVITARDPNNFNQEAALPEIPARGPQDALNLEDKRFENRQTLQSQKSASALNPEVKFLQQQKVKAYGSYLKASSEAAKYDGIIRAMSGKEAEYENTRQLAAGKMRAAQKAQEELNILDQQINALGSGVVQGAPAAVGDVNPEALIPTIPAPVPKVTGTYRRNEGYRENAQAR